MAPPFFVTASQVFASLDFSALSAVSLQLSRRTTGVGQHKEQPALTFFENRLVKRYLEF